MAHSKLSNVCVPPLIDTSKTLSYSLPQTSQVPISYPSIWFSARKTPAAAATTWKFVPCRDRQPHLNLPLMACNQRLEVILQTGKRIAKFSCGGSDDCEAGVDCMSQRSDRTLP